MNNLALKLENVSCERGDRQLFSDLSIEIEAGDIIQVQGPNGSGKTSLLKILTGISSDYEGSISWKNQNLQTALFDFRNNLLFIGHLPAVKRSLTPTENLDWFIGMSGGFVSGSKPAVIRGALASVSLQGYEDVPCYTLSAGQMRRVALARLYLSRAPVWILDEPFTAIDIAGVESLRSRMLEHVSGGGVIILTTHQDLGIDQVKLLNLLDFMGSGK
ncbi:cytochrome c biogenesis heme-transporting ATPase CcmA [Aurantivibrio infirmus]